MKNRLKFLSVIAIAVLSFSSITCFAQPSEDYNKIVSDYADKAQEYILPLEGAAKTNFIPCTGMKATVNTDVNVRKEPDANAEKITTIDNTANVIIWGFTENEWCKVFCQDKDKNCFFGYIKSNLLNE